MGSDLRCVQDSENPKFLGFCRFRWSLNFVFCPDLASAHPPVAIYYRELRKRYVHLQRMSLVPPFCRCGAICFFVASGLKTWS